MLLTAISGSSHLTIFIFLLLKSHVWRVLILKYHILELVVIKFLCLRRDSKVL